MAKAAVLKSAAEIEIMAEANRIVAGALAMLRERIKPGVSTAQLDAWAEEYARGRGGVPAFKGYRGFPGSLCVSVNEQVVHGIPSPKVTLREGDIVSIDFGVKWQGFYGDAAITVPVGEVSSRVRELLLVTQESLERAIAQVQVGKRINDISRAVQDYVEEQGFSVVRQFVGHGIGSQLHEPPEIPNYVRSNGSPRLVAGMVLAIEPMVNMGTADVKILSDGWTVITTDRKFSAHFEHSVAVTDNGPRVLSTL
ncbi:type I methionyl aminopeptidase [Desulfurivibrio alkaliphilus]|uniref:Methionine aminopeptidase n=1 Tax=Desulfurivibrio alkaliphilus (strain DSM 19089 / UNIQEM U267 / AHT2) TaxID=589865 RepID=D6Z3K1_DESAT|nr:type I methionyl aminopeptidase [Desulfurivibrio alkaliphilus]ADH86126.1 methionine aminopeptidase, type I [Desulfurivibrio alkaliphilus AHT 2]